MSTSSAVRPLTYRESERLRQAKWIVKNQMHYTDRDIRRAAELVDRLEREQEALRRQDAEQVEANAAKRAVAAMDAELAELQASDAELGCR